MNKEQSKYKLEARDINVYYGDKQVLKNIDMQIKANTVTAFIGPSGCGKSTFLRLFNRMNDYIDTFRKEGDIWVDGSTIYDKKTKIEELRTRWDGIPETQSISEIHL